MAAFLSSSLCNMHCARKGPYYYPTQWIWDLVEIIFLCTLIRQKKNCINSKRQFCTDCRAPLPSRNIFLFSRRGSSQVGGNTYTVMGQQMHRLLQLITQRFAKCLQNVWKTVKDGWKELTINAFFSQESVWGGGLHGREAPSQWQVTSATRFTTQLLVDLGFYISA